MVKKGRWMVSYVQIVNKYVYLEYMYLPKWKNNFTYNGHSAAGNSLPIIAKVNPART
jgi:hypothetical protein